MAQRATIVEYLEAGIKGASLRQSAIANNIANLGSPGYRRLAVNFEKRLARAISEGQTLDIEQMSKDVIRPKNTAVDANGNDVILEQEIGDMVKNVSMQKTYLRLLARAYRKMESAMSLR